MHTCMHATIYVQAQSATAFCYLQDNLSARIDMDNFSKSSQIYSLKTFYRNLLGSLSISTIVVLLDDKALSTAASRRVGSVTLIPNPPECSA